MLRSDAIFAVSPSDSASRALFSTWREPAMDVLPCTALSIVIHYRTSFSRDFQIYYISVGRFMLFYKYVNIARKMRMRMRMRGGSPLTDSKDM